MKILTFLAALLLGAGPALAQTTSFKNLAATVTFTAPTSTIGGVTLSSSGLQAAAGGNTLGLGTNGIEWQISYGVLTPVADNTYNLGYTISRIATGYFINLGASGYPVAKVYASQVLATTALPTISSCGTTPPAATAGSNNSGGQFTLGTGATTACTVTLATAYPTNAFCTVTPAFAYTGTYYISAQSAGAFTVTLGTGTASVKFNYSCSGN